METGDQAVFEIAGEGSWMLARLEIDHLDKVEAARVDRILAEARQRLTAALRPGDRVVAAERGFWLALALAGGDVDQRLVGRVLDAVGLQPFDLGGGQFARRTASIGWAPYPWQRAAKVAFPLPEVQRVTLRALYLAQRSGRNQAVGMLPVGSESDAAVVKVERTAGPDLVDDTPTAPIPSP